MSHVLTRPESAVDAAAVTFDQVGKSFPAHHGAHVHEVLRDVTFTVRPGEIVSVPVSYTHLTLPTIYTV